MSLTPAERIADWMRFYEASSPSYRCNALIAVLESDGEKMLNEVIGKLGITSAADLVKRVAEKP